MKKHIRKPMLLIGSLLLFLGTACALTNTLVSCSKGNGLDYSELNKIISKIDLNSIDEEKSQLRGAYTRKLIKEGNPDAIGIAYQYSATVNQNISDILDGGGSVLQAFDYLNDAAEDVNVGLMEWNVFSSYRNSFVSKISSEVNSIKGITKEQKESINSEMSNWITIEAKNAREQGRSADEFVSDFEAKMSEQLASQTIKNALIARTGMAASELAQENVLIPAKIVPDGIDLRNWTVGQDLTNLLPQLFSINSKNNPYSSTSLTGYTAKAEVSSITQTNMYTYDIEVKHSICMTQFVNQPDYWQSFTSKYTFLNSVACQQEIANTLLSEMNLQAKDIDTIAAYNDFKSTHMSSEPSTQINIADIEQVFNFNKDARLLADGNNTGFTFRASIVSWNDLGKKSKF